MIKDELKRYLCVVNSGKVHCTLIGEHSKTMLVEIKTMLDSNVYEIIYKKKHRVRVQKQQEFYTVFRIFYHIGKTDGWM